MEILAPSRPYRFPQIAEIYEHNISFSDSHSCFPQINSDSAQKFVHDAKYKNSGIISRNRYHLIIEITRIIRKYVTEYHSYLLERTSNLVNS